MAKATRKTFDGWLSIIEETLEAKQEALDSESDKDYPNQERLDKLEEEARLLEEMADLLREYIEM
jgi:hypothetical protein